MNRRRPWRGRPYRRAGGPHGLELGRHPVLLTLAVALLVAVAVIRLLELKLRPVVMELAAAQTQNTMTAVIEQAVSQDLIGRQSSYSGLIQIQRDTSGAITALTTDMAQMNLLRAQLTGVILHALEEMDVSAIQVPVGSLLGSELLWARGPTIKAKALSVGTISAEFESQLTASGVNQSLHRIWLDVSVPMTVLLPGGQLQVPVHTSLVVSETVIVGQVPETYLQLGDGAGRS